MERIENITSEDIPPPQNLNDQANSSTLEYIMKIGFVVGIIVILSEIIDQLKK